MAAVICSDVPYLGLLCGNGMFEVLGANVLLSLGQERAGWPVYVDLYPMVGAYMHLREPAAYPDISFSDIATNLKIFICDRYDKEQLEPVSHALKQMASEFDVAVPLVGIALDVPRPLDYSKKAREWAELIETVLRFRKEARPVVS